MIGTLLRTTFAILRCLWRLADFAFSCFVTVVAWRLVIAAHSFIFQSEGRSGISGQDVLSPPQLAEKLRDAVLSFPPGPGGE